MHNEASNNMSKGEHYSSVCTATTPGRTLPNQGWPTSSVRFPFIPGGPLNEDNLYNVTFRDLRPPLTVCEYSDYPSSLKRRRLELHKDPCTTNSARAVPSSYVEFNDRCILIPIDLYFVKPA